MCDGASNRLKEKHSIQTDYLQRCSRWQNTRNVPAIVIFFINPRRWLVTIFIDIAVRGFSQFIFAAAFPRNSAKVTAASLRTELVREMHAMHTRLQLDSSTLSGFTVGPQCQSAHWPLVNFQQTISPISIAQNGKNLWTLVPAPLLLFQVPHTTQHLL